MTTTKKPNSPAKAEKPPAFIFGARPEFVAAPVSFVRVTGDVVDLDCKFQYRTRKEFGALWDEISEAEIPRATDGEKFSFAGLADRGLEFSAERTLKYLSGWDLEIELNKAALVDMFDQEPNAAAAFWEAYRAAIVEGRVKNS